MEKVLTDYETHLKDKQFVLFDELTLLDFTLVYIIINAIVVMGLDVNAKHPNVKRYFDGLLDKYPPLKEELTQFQELVKNYKA